MLGFSSNPIFLRSSSAITCSVKCVAADKQTSKVAKTATWIFIFYVWLQVCSKLEWSDRRSTRWFLNHLVVVSRLLCGLSCSSRKQQLGISHLEHSSLLSHGFPRPQKCERRSDASLAVGRKASFPTQNMNHAESIWIYLKSIYWKRPPAMTQTIRSKETNCHAKTIFGMVSMYFRT